MVCEEVKRKYVPSCLKRNIYLLTMQSKIIFQINHSKTGNNETNVFMMMLLSEMNHFHSEPLDASHP